MLFSVYGSGEFWFEGVVVDEREFFRQGTWSPPGDYVVIVSERGFGPEFRRIDTPQLYEQDPVLVVVCPD